MPNSDFVDNSPSSANDSTSQGSSALSGAASGAEAGAVFGPWGAAIGAVVGGVVGYFSAPKKPVYKPINVDAIVSEARQNYADNYNNSLALERSGNPDSAYARNQTDKALGAAADQTSAGFQARNAMLDDVMNGKSAALYNESSDSILQQLRQGGRLDPETQASVTRGALTTGSGSGITGSIANRGLVARDLGLTSLSLQQSRQQAALQASAAGVSRLQVGNAAAGLDASTAASLGSIFNQRGLPQAGLDPRIAAQLRVDNTVGAGKIDLLNTATDNAARAKNVQSVLSLGSGAAGAFGGGGTTTSIDNSSAYGLSGTGGYSDMDGITTRCWVAREVYGADNPEWIQFRDRMLATMDKSFVEFYLQKGPAIAATIRDQPEVKQFIRGLMDQIKK